MFTSMLMQVRIHPPMQVQTSMVNGEGGRLGAKRRGGRPEADAGGYFLNGRSSLRMLTNGVYLYLLIIWLLVLYIYIS
jgi:hypothetical protein